MKDTRRFALRIARDQLIDQVLYPMCSTVPLPDLPVTAKSNVVSFDRMGTIIIDPAQNNVNYQLLNENNVPMSSAMRRKNYQLEFDTQPLQDEDYIFYVLAKNKTTGLSKKLIQNQIIKVGVDVNLDVEVTPTTPEYNQPVQVLVRATQPNNTYQLFDAGVEPPNPLSAVYESGKGGDLILTSIPLTEDIQIRVKATNNKTTQNDFLLEQPFITVYPDTKLFVELKAPATGVEYLAIPEIGINNAQASTDYQLIFMDIDDDTVDKVALANSNVGQMVKGTGKNITLKATAAKEDLWLLIRATKRNSKLTRDLQTIIFIPVKPDPARVMEIFEPVTAVNDEGTIRIIKGQRGIYYQLVNAASGELIGWRRYFHKNYGIGKGKVGINLAVDTVPEEDVFLSTGPIAQETEIMVIAKKATTEITNTMTQKLTLKIG